MYLFILAESNVNYSQQLKDLRAFYNRCVAMFSFNSRFYAAKHKNKCRMYFFIKSSADMSCDMFLRLASLYAPNCYVLVHDFQREYIITLKNANIVKSAMSTTSHFEVFKRLNIPDNVISSITDFFDLRIIHSNF